MPPYHKKKLLICRLGLVTLFVCGDEEECHKKKASLKLILCAFLICACTEGI